MEEGFSILEPYWDLETQKKEQVCRKERVCLSRSFGFCFRGTNTLENNYETNFYIRSKFLFWMKVGGGGGFNEREKGW